MKKVVFFLVFTLHLFSKEYILEYRGITIGTINNLNTIYNGYLVARFDNPIAYTLNGFKEHYVFYKEGEQPFIKDAKFKLDKENFIESVAWLISNPSTKQLQINTKRMLDVHCETKDYCKWDYFYKGEHRRNGYVKFNDGKFVEYSDITQNIKIIESK